jgi:hypothetical protein
MSLALPFTEQGSLDDDFAQDVRVLCGDSHYEHLSEYMADFLRTIARPEAESLDRAAEMFETKHPVLKLPNINQSFRLLRNLAMFVADENLTSQDLLEAKSMLAPSFENKEDVVLRLAEVVKQLSAERQNIERSQQRERKVAGVMPMLKGWDTSIDARVIWDSADNEAPTFIPIASILLGFDSGTPNKITFQVTPIVLRRLIDELQVIDADLRLAAGPADSPIQ